MKQLKTLADLTHFVQRSKALVFCSATWVKWLADYREELDEGNLPIAEIDVDNPAFMSLLQMKFVMNVPSFMLYCDGEFRGVTVGKMAVSELEALIKGA
jgi:hypothetical protein